MLIDGEQLWNLMIDFGLGTSMVLPLFLGKEGALLKPGEIRVVGGIRLGEFVA